MSFVPDLPEGKAVNRIVLKMILSSSHLIQNIHRLTDFNSSDRVFMCLKIKRIINLDFVKYPGNCKFYSILDESGLIDRKPGLY